MSGLQLLNGPAVALPAVFFEMAARRPCQMALDPPGWRGPFAFASFAALFIRD